MWYLSIHITISKLIKLPMLSPSRKYFTLACCTKKDVINIIMIHYQYLYSDTTLFLYGKDNCEVLNYLTELK